jgi:hypothetical protein
LVLLLQKKKKTLLFLKKKKKTFMSGAAGRCVPGDGDRFCTTRKRR